MKKFILLSVLIGSFASAHAQLKSEFNINYGYATREMILNGFGAIPYKNYSSDSRGLLNKDIAARTFDVGERAIYYGGKKRTGAIFATYRLQLIKALSVGLTAGYDKEWAELNVSDPVIRNLVTVGKYERNAITIAPEVQVTYKTLPLVKMYGNVGMGVTLVNEKIAGNKGTETIKGDYFAFQVTPFGIRVGKKLAGFGEAGYGYKGAVSLGLSYRF